MKLWLYCLIILISVFCIIIVGVDFISNSIHNIKRYHIGRWDTVSDWTNAVEKTTRQWLLHLPIVQQTDNRNYIALDYLKGRYKNSTIQSWQAASIALGIFEKEKNVSEKSDLTKWKNKYLTKNGKWKCNVNKIDFAMLAYAILKCSGDYERVKPAMDKIIEMIEKNLCNDGMISYSQGSKSDIRYVDTLGMVCPFLTLYGKIYDQSKYIGMAIHQLSNFHEHGMLKCTSLPCHAYKASDGLPLSIYGWGRGTAWYFLGLLDTYKELEDCKEKNVVKIYLEEAAKDYIKYQSNDGGFSTILQGSGQYDSSITAAMAYFYRSCFLIFHDKEYEKIADKCLQKLMTVTMQSGAVDVCQGDTHGLGNFSTVFDIMPFAQGLLLRAISLEVEDL